MLHLSAALVLSECLTQYSRLARSLQHDQMIETLGFAALVDQMSEEDHQSLFPKFYSVHMHGIISSWQDLTYTVLEYCMH